MDAQTTQVSEQLAEQVLDKLVANPSVNLRTMDKIEIKDQVIAATQAVIVNQTNQEPWYKSVITVTQIVGMIVSVLAIFGVFISPDDVKLIISIWLGVVAVIQPITTLWARWIAKTGFTSLGGTTKT